MASYSCRWCGQQLMTESARAQHEDNCSENPANEGKQD